MKNLNYPFLIALCFTFYMLGSLSQEVGKEQPAHYYSAFLPITGFGLLNILFFLGYFAAKNDEDGEQLPAWRSVAEKLKDKAWMFWISLAFFFGFNMFLFTEVGTKAPAATYSWELPLMCLIIHAWIFGMGYASRYIEYQKVIKKY